MSRRIQTIDFGRGVSVILMILVHTLWIHAKQEVQTQTALGHFIHFVGRGTPVFLIAMGFSFMLSRNQSLGSATKRGIYILGVAFLMNFLKFVIPILFGFAPQNFIEAYGWQNPIATQQLIYLVLTGDILQLAGSALLIIGLIRKYVSQRIVLLLLAILIAFMSRWFTPIHTDFFIVNYIQQLFFSNDFWVYFPVFPWLSFIVLGMFFGKLYMENNKDQKKLFIRMLIYGLFFIITGSFMLWHNHEYHFNDFFHLGPGGVIYLAGWNFTVLFFFYLLLHYTRDNLVYKFIFYCSKNVTSIYVIQWVVICWAMGIFGFQNSNLWETLLLMPFFVTITFFIQYLLDMARTKNFFTLTKRKEFLASIKKRT